MSFSFSDPLASSKSNGTKWKDPFLFGSLTPEELSVVFDAGHGFSVTVPEDFEKYQYEEGALPPRLSAIDAKTSDWAALFTGPGAHNHQNAVEEEEPVAEEPKEPLGEVLRQLMISTEPLCVLPRGLSNPDNKCFLNSVLQSFIYCSPFCRFLTELTRAEIPRTQYPFLYKLNQFREFKGQATKGLPFSAAFFYDTLSEFNCKAINGQEDAQEYLSFLLEKAHEELLKASTPTKRKRAVLDDESGWYQVVAGTTKTATVIHTELDSSPIYTIFGGSQQSQLLKQGLPPSINVESFLCLPLDINNPSIMSLESALSMYTAKETIEGYVDNGREIAVTKQVKLEKLPLIMIIQLKRFTYNNEGMFKVQKNISYPRVLHISKDWYALFCIPEANLIQRYLI